MEFILLNTFIVLFLKLSITARRQPPYGRSFLIIPVKVTLFFDLVKLFKELKSMAGCRPC